MAETKVLVLVGSLRAASLNRQLAEVAVESASDGVTVRVADGLGELPFYNEDLDNESAPEAVVALRQIAGDADAFLAVTPEYNGTIPAVLKNAIDWLSRPYGAGAVVGKPLAVVGTAAGQYGGVWAHDESRKSFGVAGANVVDVKLSLAASAFDGKHPRETAEVVEGVRGVIAKLAAEVG
ncbi:NAD(P)H-dependent oxidoreductase [Mycobacterium sp. CBMA293]|uniref:NADPH-dependent FMN reductase n=1 Tax=unclassified Mycolicibacterium TaxID=2636767 RepID=UPI0012DC08B0|nr:MULTISPECIES: NADPH-dependent FMN reductase [unclassified Mycolicibacterium]MUL45396.1 NAD(P)H-dependent oxidoreductase [Mycolicibacterium sp. CBMA 360]MUL56916.1 NAD(P)H-dependent oxidoreductase [Mycolicibacterium sp. CBMA 335]MUL69956.1 NAD(P)H-dependent oxidoreductase [Mycolicibacterium sp. CBMA 311]MUL92004.1 NAD(P)H-dependent oxidoreductase [Mycolicibacterium sp. CBMA 230]MUM05742.1 FMN reductase [Mycolicibacterium sp. CBMA 213]